MNTLSFFLKYSFPAFVISSLLIPLVILISKKKNIFARPNFRRRQSQPIPLWGGISIFLACSIVSTWSNDKAFSLLLLSSLPLIFIGLMDDIKELRPAIKLSFQMLSTLVWLTLIPYENLITHQIGWSAFLGYPFLFIWILGLINATNMIDGLDALAGSFAFLATLFLAFLYPTSSFALFTFMGALGGFLIFNFPPAKVYLGEAGSTFLGFFLATQASTIQLPSANPVLITLPLFILSFPEVDTILSIIRRFKANTSPFKGDHDHIHHKLFKLTGSKKITLLIILGVNAYSGLTAILIYHFHFSSWAWGIVALSTIGLLTLLTSVLLLESTQAYQVSRFSKTILHKYLPRSQQLTFDPDQFEAVVYDLLPYYKELQNRGVGDVQNFVQDFAKHIETFHGKCFLHVIGSYSIIAIKSGGSKCFFSRKTLCKAFYQLLKAHKVQKNDDNIPLGMSFYSSHQKQKDFLKKFNLAPFIDKQKKLFQQKAS